MARTTALPTPRSILRFPFRRAVLSARQQRCPYAQSAYWLITAGSKTTRSGRLRPTDRAGEPL
jgi:hypothetical protein